MTLGICHSLTPVNLKDYKYRLSCTAFVALAQSCSLCITKYDLAAVSTNGIVFRQVNLFRLKGEFGPANEIDW